VPSNTFGKAYVVVAKRPETKELVVAFDGTDTPGLYATRCRVGSISVTNRPLSSAASLLAQPRYRSEAAAVSAEFLDAETAWLTFAKPQRALTPGQICAFYEGETLLGGGVFEEILE
jgi:tRNA-specific 2-thiouridylase